MTDINVCRHGSGETRQHTQRCVGLTQVKQDDIHKGYRHGSGETRQHTQRCEGLTQVKQDDIHRGYRHGSGETT